MVAPALKGLGLGFGVEGFVRPALLVCRSRDGSAGRGEAKGTRRARREEEREARGCRVAARAQSRHVGTIILL